MFTFYCRKTKTVKYRPNEVTGSIPASVLTIFSICKGYKRPFSFPSSVLGSIATSLLKFTFCLQLLSCCLEFLTNILYTVLSVVHYHSLNADFQGVVSALRYSYDVCTVLYGSHGDNEESMLKNFFLFSA